jgi:hypothetical protein
MEAVMAGQPVPRRTLIGAALAGVAGLMASSPALATRPGKTRPKMPGAGAMPVNDDEIRAAIDTRLITELVLRLGRWLDLKQYDDAAITESMFVPTVLVGSPGRTGGAAQGIASVVVKARKRHDGIGSQHAFTNVLVELHGDTASAGAELLATFVPDPQKPTFFSQLGARYEFDFVRVGRGWKFSRIDDRTVWRQDLPTLSQVR